MIQKLKLPINHQGLTNRWKKNQLNEKIEDALNALPIRHKTAIILSYYEGYKNSDSAELLGLNTKAMESLLHRARKNLHDILTQKGVTCLDFEVQ